MSKESREIIALKHLESIAAAYHPLVEDDWMASTASKVEREKTKKAIILIHRALLKAEDSAQGRVAAEQMYSQATENYIEMYGALKADYENLKKELAETKSTLDKIARMDSADMFQAGDRVMLARLEAGIDNSTLEVGQRGTIVGFCAYRDRQNVLIKFDDFKDGYSGNDYYQHDWTGQADEKDTSHWWVGISAIQKIKED